MQSLKHSSVAVGIGIIQKRCKVSGRLVEFKISDRALELGLEGLRKNVDIHALLVGRGMPLRLGMFIVETGLKELASEETRQLGLPFRIFTSASHVPEIGDRILSGIKLAREMYASLN